MITAIEPTVTPQYVANLLGKSTSTITRWLNNGKMPGIRLEGRWRITIRQLNPWLVRRGTAPIPIS